MSSFLDGFELVSPISNASRPIHGKPRLTVSKTQFSFSKALAEGINNPNRIDFFKGKGENKIAITAGNSLSFCLNGVAKKITRKDPEILRLLHSALDCRNPGTYYCIDAEYVEDEGQLYAVFNLDKAERYMIAESVIKKLGRKSLPVPEVKEIQILMGGQ